MQIAYELSMSDGLNFEWDDAKRQQTILKHGLDFLEVVKIFPTLGPVWKSPNITEERWVAVGILENVEITVIYNVRNGNIQIVTARRARTNERKAFNAYNAGRSTDSNRTD